MFVMVAGWHNTSPAMSVVDRIAHTMSDSAGKCVTRTTITRLITVAITITSLTSAIGFAIGCLTTIPATQLFCAYAAASIAFNYLMQVCSLSDRSSFIYIPQVTFFAACMVYHGQWEHAGKHSLYPCTGSGVVASINNTTERYMETPVKNCVEGSSEYAHKCKSGLFSR